MFEQIILGIIQGVFEWLPVSSEGVITLIKTNFFQEEGISQIIRFSLFLHLGTFLSALIYFRQDVGRLLKALVAYKKTNEEDKNILVFLLIATIISGTFGFLLLQTLIHFEESIQFSARIINLLIGFLLLITAGLQLRKKQEGIKKISNLKIKDGILLGLMQGLAVLPGLSRSGLTVSTLLLRKFKDTVSLKLSFLMSLPIVLAGNIVLNLEYFTLSSVNLIGLLFSFLFGIATIHLLLKFAQKVNFGWFILFFGILMIFSVII
jgi:undecaprenyl-diphosphatase